MAPFEVDMLAEIDPLALDKSWLEQTKLYIKTSTALADARHEMDQAKNQLLIVEAECDKLVRARPEKYGMDKVTEKAVAVAVQMHPKMQAAQATMLEAKYESDMMSGLLQALEHRKEALKALTTLFLNEYYGTGPASVSKESREMIDRSRQTTRKKGQTTSLPRKNPTEDDDE